MANCVHPRILLRSLSQPFNDVDAVKARFRGIQANTSPLPYSQLETSSPLLSIQTLFH